MRDSKICFSWFKLCQSSFMPRWNFLAQSRGLTLLVDSRCWFECLKYLDGLNRSVNPRLMILNVLERNLRSDKKGPMLKLAWLWFRGLHNILSALKPLFTHVSLLWRAEGRVRKSNNQLTLIHSALLIENWNHYSLTLDLKSRLSPGSWAQLTLRQIVLCLCLCL